MTRLDHQTATLTEALVYRLRNRGSGPGQYATDDDVFAREFVGPSAVYVCLLPCFPVRWAR